MVLIYPKDRKCWRCGEDLRKDKRGKSRIRTTTNGVYCGRCGAVLYITRIDCKYFREHSKRSLAREEGYCKLKKENITRADCNKCEDYK